MATVHVGDVGVLIRLTVTQDGAARDISTASTKQIQIVKPDGSVVVRNASFTATGVNGQLEAATQSGDLDLEGRYAACAYLVIGGWSGHTGALAFSVRAVGV